ncbi:hypothetical protein H9Y04_34295 [Streptomyces sp. TRM66268-LWL]|uniref:DUF3558 domain-containing protein n=1 Tax=Streptomyces polyasparticus TaxID=2767826 RepID=A0ABR7SQ49_9ACTN|nr:hypothetical protein [Streptomyces polyasparticus]MBC9717615.1 hypothetical protein [Streptomyces polyasparticus]
MISEPELVGEDGEIPSYALDVVAPPDPVRRDPGRRPWLWALGGAAAASAVWAGSLYGVQGDEKPDLQGYRLPTDLCTVSTLTSLSAKYGKPVPEHRAIRQDDALDRGWCVVQLGDPKHGITEYSVCITFALHKEIDPEPEFKTLAMDKDWYDESEAAAVTEVTDLGERAYYVPGESYGMPELQVLDGPAVLQMTLNAGYNDWAEENEEFTEPPEPDFKGVRERMIEDMKSLMRALKK